MKRSGVAWPQSVSAVDWSSCGNLRRFLLQRSRCSCRLRRVEPAAPRGGDRHSGIDPPSRTRSASSATSAPHAVVCSQTFLSRRPLFPAAVAPSPPLTVTRLDSQSAVPVRHFSAARACGRAVIRLASPVAAHRIAAHPHLATTHAAHHSRWSLRLVRPCRDDSTGGCVDALLPRVSLYGGDDRGGLAALPHAAAAHAIHA